MKSGPEPIFIMSTPRHRRPRTFLSLTMLLLLLVVVFGAFKILPLGPAGGLSQRHTRRLLAEASNFESQSLFQNAIELYQQVSDDPKARASLRAQAALRWRPFYTDQLKDPKAAELALEKAYFYLPEGKDKTAAGQHLADLRGVPLYMVTKKSADTAKASLGSTPPSGHVLAQIGGESVLLEDVLYAWSQFHGAQQPRASLSSRSSAWYLDATLMADEAKREGLDKLNRSTLDYRLKRLVQLNQALSKKMVNEVKPPTAERVGCIQQKKWLPRLQQRSRSARSSSAIAPSPTRSAKSWPQAPDFQAVANDYSMDKGRLKDGYVVGEIRPEDQIIPYIGEEPGLGMKLAACADGATTGPIRTANGYH